MAQHNLNLPAQYNACEVLLHNCTSHEADDALKKSLQDYVKSRLAP